MLGTLLTLTSATAASAQLLDLVPRDVVSSTRSITKRCEGDELPAAQYTLKLAAKIKRPHFKHAALEALRTQLGDGAQLGPYGAGLGPYTAAVAGSGGDGEYLVNITIGKQDFSVIVDTGSSDTWLAEKGFDCFTLADEPQPESACAFGPLFDPKASPTYVPIEGKNFNISYGDHEFLNGVVANETVKIAGMTVKHQTIGVVNAAAWRGDGVDSGLLGLAYPELTSVYNGTNPAEDNYTNWTPYSPLFYTAISSGVLKAPLFSIALNRGTFEHQVNSTYDPDLGYLSFGGIAPVKVLNNTASVPVQKLNSTHRGQQYFYYLIDVTYNTTGSHGTPQQAILDTGTTLNYIPTHLARQFAAAFDPPAQWYHQYGLFLVDCKAKAPPFSVVLGGKSFPISPKDQVIPAGEDDQGNIICITGTQPGGTINAGNIFILGDTFLHNVVMTFNPDHEEVFITERVPY